MLYGKYLRLRKLVIKVKGPVGYLIVLP